jgi:hypothetical protein
MNLDPVLWYGIKRKIFGPLSNFDRPRGSSRWRNETIRYLIGVAYCENVWTH